MRSDAAPARLTTPRLILRQWQVEDFSHFAVMSADPEVMRYYPNVLTSEASDKMARKIQGLIASQGWGFWAVECRERKQFLGFVGLHKPTYALPVSPCLEVGWRLAKAHWGRGYATEAALACLEYAFRELSADVVYAFTSVQNRPSSRVMERIYMRNTHRNFEHPHIPEGHPLREHVLYSVTLSQWLAGNGTVSRYQ